jgi:hypothetical protein
MHDKTSCSVLGVKQMKMTWLAMVKIKRIMNWNILEEFIILLHLRIYKKTICTCQTFLLKYVLQELFAFMTGKRIPIYAKFNESSIYSSIMFYTFLMSYFPYNGGNDTRYNSKMEKTENLTILNRLREEYMLLSLNFA